MGIGALIFGRLSDRIGRPVLVYAGVEAAIGVYGLVSHALLERGALLYEIAARWAEGSPGRLLAGRLAVSFVLIAIPTTLMGGTFPLMVRLLRGSRATLELEPDARIERRTGSDEAVGPAEIADAGRAAGRAYAINTAGAALGTMALPFVLLPVLGVAASLAAAAVANFAACLLVLLPKPAKPSAPPSSQIAPARSRRRRLTRTEALVLCSFLLSSFAAIALETIWTRHLGIVFGAKLQILAFVLFAYLVGLFLGGALYARLRGKGRNAAWLFRMGLLVAGVGAAAPIPFLDRLLLPQVELMLRVGVTYGSYLATSGVVTLALILVPAAGFGIVFPAAIDLLAGERRRVGSSVGLAYVINTAGTTMGALAAGFLLVPAVGSQRALEVCALLVAVSIALAPTHRPSAAFAERLIWRAGLPALLLLPMLTGRWDWRLAHSQYVKDPLGFVKRYQDDTIWPLLQSYDIRYLEEGIEATVSVCKFGDGSRSLYVNGKADASNILDDMVVQRLLGIVPLLFQPSPQRALVIGIGSGTTVAMLRRGGVADIDAAEISPEVVEAARLHFQEIAEGALDDPRVHLRLDDGRNFLHFQPDASYDLIVSEPSNPWLAGVSGLFTDEFFAEVEAKLKPGGIAVQWFHIYTMSPEHVRVIVRTFRRHFPQSALFLTRSQKFNGDMMIVGSKGPLRLLRLPDDPAVPATIKLALGEIMNAGVHPILSGLAAGPSELESFAGEGPLNTDDRPLLELEAPADLFEGLTGRTLAALIGSHREVHLAAGPTPEESGATAEIARDGFALPLGPPNGRETRRGVTVLTRLPPEAEPQRWVLIGRAFENDGAVTDLFWLARPLGLDEELAIVASSLAQNQGAPATAPRSEASAAPPAPVLVNGHSGVGIADATAATRSVVVGWGCPVRRRAFFLRRTVPHSGAFDPRAIAEDLAARFPCSHAAQ